MGDGRNFTKRLDKLFEEYNGNPDEVFRALEIDGGSDEDNSSDDEDDLFDLDTALETAENVFVTGEQEFDSDVYLSNEVQPAQNIHVLQPLQLDNPLDDILSSPHSPSVQNDGTPAPLYVISPKNQPIAGTSKDPQPVPSTFATDTTKTTPNTQKSPAQGTRKSPRNTTPNQTFTRRRDGANIQSANKRVQLNAPNVEFFYVLMLKMTVLLSFIQIKSLKYCI